MVYDVERIRTQFPALREGAAHFDAPGGTQVPDVVGDAVAGALTAAIANRGRVTAAERRADDLVSSARAAMADLLGADGRGIVFGRSMTQLTYDFARTLAKSWRPGDEVVVSRLDHDANVRPWVQAAEASGATVRWAAFDRDTAELSVADVEAVLTDRTRVVAVTAASNLIGTRPPIADIAAAVHAAGAILYVDGVHATAHTAIDVHDLGADLYVCSPYKLLGPHCGVLAGRPDLLEALRPDKLLPSTDEIPERFELGTLPYELLAGCAAAVDFVAGLCSNPTSSRRDRIVASMNAVEVHEDTLRVRLERAIADLPALTSWSRAQHRTPTVLLTIDGRTPADAARHLATLGVNAPAGSFYALETSRWLGLGDTGGLRIGFAPYTDGDDVERLVSGLASLALE